MKNRHSVSDKKSYSRQMINFKFNDYCIRHLRANNQLDCYDANIDPTSQVTAFLKGIKADQRNNPGLMSVKTIVATHPTASNNIWKAVELFKETMIAVGIDLTQRERQHIGLTQGSKLQARWMKLRSFWVWSRA